MNCDELFEMDEYEVGDEDEDSQEVRGRGDGGSDTEPVITFHPKSMTPTQLKEEMDDIVDKAKQSLPPEMTSDAVKLALDLNAWNCDDLVSSTFNHPDGEAGYFSSLHVPFGPSPITREIITDNDPVDCAICGCGVQSKDIHRHRCGAEICVPCWEEYIRTEVLINNRGNITCPNCPLLLEPRLIKELSGDTAIKLRLDKAALDAFIQKSRHHQRCPVPNCEHAFRLDDPTYGGWKWGVCGCGSVSCLDCRKPWHGPMDCNSKTRWEALFNNNDEETKQWLLENSKPCPKCGTPIQKNGGCNFMTCRHPSCRHTFCWICLGNGHEFSYGETCANYNPKNHPLTNAITKAKVIRDRYHFYLARYQNMVDSTRMDGEKVLLREILATKERLMAKGSGSQELSYLDDIPWVLKRSKLALAHSYALLYFTHDNPERACFENSLTFLQVKVDGLSWWLQYEFPKIQESSEISAFVKDNVSFCKSRVELMDSISEHNYKNDLWKFSDLDEESKIHGRGPNNGDICMIS